jgi:TolB-like protein/tetratricopeptide (TPR) repeat protein
MRIGIDDRPRTVFRNGQGLIKVSALPMDVGLQSDVRRFATFEVDLQARELRKRGVRVPLQDQPFQILVLMLERPGDVVTREELRQQLWPDGTIVDFEHSLNAAVKRLRTALGDEADNPRFVETLHRRGYRFIADVNGATPGATTRHAFGPETQAATGPRGTAKLRLVVLPFTNLDGNGAQDYFSDGLTEEMITQIGRLCPGRLGVIARTSAMLLKRAGKSASEIGRELGVDYLLEGSARTDGARVRITAQLIEARGETHLWAETYDRKLEDCLLVQSDVAARIAHSLGMELIPDQRDAIALRSPRRTGAYQAYLKGRYHWNRPGDEGLRSAIVYYDQALALDPQLADAYAAKARAKICLADYSDEPGSAVLEDARALALRALELDPGLADAHVAVAEVRKALEWDWAGAEAAYQTAIAAAPSCEAAHRAYSVFLASMARSSEALIESERACELERLCLTVTTSAAWVRYAARRFDDVVERCRDVLDMDPNYPPARRLLSAAYLHVGRESDAIKELENAVGRSCSQPVSMAWLAHALAVSGRRTEAEALCQKLEALAAVQYVPAYHIALAQVGLGDLDAAFAALARACKERDPSLMNLQVEPRFDLLRNDRRHVAFLEQLRLP